MSLFFKMQSFLWGATGEMVQLKNMETFENDTYYSISIIVMDATSKKIINTFMYTNLSSKTTPIVNIIPNNFDVSISNKVILEIQDNTDYNIHFQAPLQLLLQAYGLNQPMLLSFTSTQLLDNITMRSVTTPPLPYQNITLYFKQ